MGVLGGLATSGRFNVGEDAIIIGEAGTKGLGTGAKATYNASGDTLIGFATLGYRDMEAFGLRVQPTEEEVQLGYYYAEGFSRGGQELGFAVLTGGASRASSVGQAAMILDAAGNINGVKRNGDQGNYLAAAGHGAGLTGNFGALQRVRLDKFRVVPLDEVVGTRNGAQISGGKFDYLFGNARGAKNAAHNAPRTAQNLEQMKRLGLFDDAAGRKLLQSHFDDVVNDTSNITKSYTNKYGTFEMRESLFAGPSGQFAKFESTWEVLADGTRRLTTVIPLGGR